MRLLIVGGGPAALATARGYREAGGDGDVTLLTPRADASRTPARRSPRSSCAARSTTTDLPIEDAGWYADHGVDVRLGAEVETLDPGRAHARCSARARRSRYDACVLATGAEPTPLPVPGATEEWVLTAAQPRDRARAARPRRSRRRPRSSSARASSAARPPRRWPCAASKSRSSPTRRSPQRHGSATRPAARIQRLARGRSASSWCSAPRVEAIGEHACTSRARPPIGRPDPDGRRRQPCAGLAETAGLDDAATAGSSSTRTCARRAEDVYAAGDVALAHNAAAGRHLAVEHWGEALNMGEVAGRDDRRRGRAVGRRPRLLVDDRRAHAQVRRLGRRLRRDRASSTTAAARGRSGTAPRARPSACSPTSATRTTSAAASWSRPERRCREQRRASSSPRATRRS